MEWLIVLWPFAAGAVIALAIRTRHRRLAAGGAALIFVGTFVVSLGASDDGWIISERELLQAAAFVWTAAWLCGVGLGAGIRRIRRGDGWESAG